MARYNGGDFIEITYNHPTIGSGVFFIPSNEDGTVDYGGRRSEDDANAITADGQMIDKIKQTRWMWEGMITWNKGATNELQTLVDLAASPVNANWTFTHIDGSIFGATGKPVGDLQGSGQNATIAVKFAGGGVMALITESQAT